MLHPVRFATGSLGCARFRIVWHRDWYGRVMGTLQAFPLGNYPALCRQDDASSLDAVLHSVDPKLTRWVLAFDIRRDGVQVAHDLLKNEPYGSLRRLALKGDVSLVGGSCRTWSILRRFPKPAAPIPVRARTLEAN